MNQDDFESLLRDVLGAMEDAGIKNIELDAETENGSITLDDGQNIACEGVAALIGCMADQGFAFSQVPWNQKEIEGGDAGDEE